MKRSDIKKLDALWAEVVKTRAGFVCEHCNIRGVRMEAAHVVGRRHRATRWGMKVPPGTIIEVPNDVPIQFFKPVLYDLCGHCFCHNCHQQYDEHGPLEKNIVELTIGKERKARLQLEANKLVSKDQYYEEISEILETIQQGGGI